MIRTYASAATFFQRSNYLFIHTYDSRRYCSIKQTAFKVKDSTNAYFANNKREWSRPKNILSAATVFTGILTTAYVIAEYRSKKEQTKRDFLFKKAEKFAELSEQCQELRKAIKICCHRLENSKTFIEMKNAKEKELDDKNYAVVTSMICKAKQLSDKFLFLSSEPIYYNEISDDDLLRIFRNLYLDTVNRNSDIRIEFNKGEIGFEKYMKHLNAECEDLSNAARYFCHYMSCKLSEDDFYIENARKLLITEKETIKDFRELNTRVMDQRREMREA